MVTAIKRVSPNGTEPTMSLKAGVTIEPGQAVKIGTADTATVGALKVVGTGNEPIGWAMYDQAHVAIKNRTAFNPGEVLSVRLRNPIVTVTCDLNGTTIGHYLQAAATGYYVDQGATKTVASAGIAIEVKTGTAEVKMIPI